MTVKKILTATPLRAPAGLSATAVSDSACRGR